jgi:protein required for attachment to host cells
MLRWLKTVVVSDEEKAHVMRQVGTGKANVGEPLVKRRDIKDDIETGEYPSSRDEPGGCPLIGQVVSGVEVA